MTKDQARTSRPTSRRALAVGATHRWPEEPVADDQAAILPAVQHIAEGRLTKLALDARGAGRQPAEQDPEDVGAGGVLLAEPAQGGDVAVGDAGVGVPARPPRHPGARSTSARSGPWAMDLRAGPCTASPKETLFGHVNLRVG